MPPPGGATAGTTQCQPDTILNFLRGAPDLTLYLSLAVLTGFLQRQLSDPGLSATLLLPSDAALRAFLQQQGLSAASIYVYAPQLESVLAYHTLPQPLSYADLARAGASGAPLPTDLPGATLKATPLNATALRLDGPYSSANLVRANQLVCRTVAHVVDAVLLPARSIQNVLPYDQAVGGLQASPPLLAPGQPPGPPGCVPSLAEAMASTPQLSIARTTLGLTSWNLTNPGLNVTMFAVTDAAQQVSIAGLLAPDQGQIQQLIGEAARDSRLLHAGIAYQVVVGYGGLNTTELEKMEGEELPTLFKPHTITVEPGPDGGVAIAGELTNRTAATVVQSIATCGGSVLNILSGPVSPHTPAADLYLQGEPLTAADLALGYEDYSPQEAQSEVDATVPPPPPPTASAPPPPAATTAGVPSLPAALAAITDGGGAVPAPGPAPASPPAGVLPGVQPPTAFSLQAPSGLPGVPGAPTATGISSGSPGSGTAAPSPGGTPGGMTVPAAGGTASPGSLAAALLAPGGSPAAVPLAGVPGGTAAGGPTATLPVPAAQQGTAPAVPPVAVPAAAPGGTSPSTCMTLQDFVNASPDYFSRIAQLAAQFGWDVVPRVDNVTYFVPSDAAINAFFQRFSPQTVQALMLSHQALAALAAYHMLGRAVRTSEMVDGQRLQTLARDPQGNPLFVTVRRDGTGTISLLAVGSTASIIMSDIPVCKGFAQVIDSLLLPVVPPDGGPPISPVPGPPIVSASG
ncbi:hypothetical protein ABPG75_010521 [Micractinium tetrahymenae]